jgi:DNA polymerase-1
MLVEADLNAAELRVIAALSGDRRLGEAFERGESPHAENAAAMFGRPCPKGSEEYVFAKSFMFRFCYLPPGEPPSMGKLRTYRVAISDADMARYLAVLERRYVGIVAWKRRTIERAWAERKVRNPWGRFLDISWAMMAGPEYRRHIQALALNYPVQTSVGEVMDENIIRVHRALPRGARLIAQLHDALLVETPDALTDAVVEVLDREMRWPIQELGGITIPPEIKVGPNWADMTPVSGR